MLSKSLESSFLTQEIKYQFLKNICKLLNVDYAVAVNSATSALYIACLSLNLKAGDILLTSQYLCSIRKLWRYCNAKVDFIDIDPNSGLIDIELLSLKLKMLEMIINYRK